MLLTSYGATLLVLVTLTNRRGRTRYYNVDQTVHNILRE